MPRVHNLLRLTALSLVSVAGLLATSTCSTLAQEHYFQNGSPENCRNCRHFAGGAGYGPYTYGQPDLFANYYVNPTAGGVGASLYVAPQPVPPHVGHTYITYQPFMPHELLYDHHRHYHRYYEDGRGLTRTSVSWHSPPFKHSLHTIHHGLKLAR